MSDKLIIYPNPAKNDFTVELQLNNQVSKEVNISIVNIVGEEIYIKTTSVINNKLAEQINLPGIASGLYVISVSSGEIAINGHLVIE